MINLRSYFAMKVSKFNVLCLVVSIVAPSEEKGVAPAEKGVAPDKRDTAPAAPRGSGSAPIVIKRGRGNAKSLDKEKLQMPLKAG